jgi:hypothetical protein
MTEMRKSKAASIISRAYLLLALASLALIFVSSDSLSGVFAALIIQPWASLLALITDRLGIDSLAFNTLFLLAGAVSNAWILYKLVGFLVARFGREP